MDETDQAFMARAIALSERTALVDRAGAPFGAVVVLDGEIVGEGANRVEAENDPTWHAEMEAIRAACRAAGTTRLTGAVLYASGEPCAMCLSAAEWADIGAIYYASNVEDIVAYGDVRRGEINTAQLEKRPPIRQMMRSEAVEIWKKYREKRAERDR